MSDTDAPPAPPTRLGRDSRRRPALEITLASAVVVLPLVVALASLAGRRWYPVLDLAMTEFRLRDVGTSETPLIGLPGRIGELPDQGSHPGPLSFWILGPLYRLFGSSAWAMEAATVVVHVAWSAVALWLGHRRKGITGTVAVAVVLAVAVRGFGLTVLVQPWNPYLPLVAWLVVLLAAWSVLDGDHWMLVVLLLAASFVAQTHIPYLLLAGSLGLAATVLVIVRSRRSSDAAATQPVAITAVAFVLLWAGTIIDQVVRDPGNVSRLLDHFSSPSDDPIGVGPGLRLLLRHLDPVTYLGLLSGERRFLESGFDADGPILGGIAVLLVWVAAAVASVALDLPRTLRHLHLVIAATLVVSWLSMSRIFGLRWFYLTLWAWVTTAVALLAIAWSVVEIARRRYPDGEAASVRLVVTGAAIAGVLTIANVVAAGSTDHAEEDLGETLGELVDPTVDALTAQGVAGPVLVDFDDSYFFGSQAFGLVSELERAGFDAGMVSFWSVPVTSSRVVDVPDATTKVVLVTGGFVDDWRAEPAAVEIAAVDPRSDEERARFDELRGRLVDDLGTTGLGDLVALVDTNLFGLNVDLRISAEARRLSGEMIGLGQETAVFVTAPDVVPESRR